MSKEDLSKVKENQQVVLAHNLAENEISAIYLSFSTVVLLQ